MVQVKNWSWAREKMYRATYAWLYYQLGNLARTSEALVVEGMVQGDAKHNFSLTLEAVSSVVGAVIHDEKDEDAEYIIWLKSVIDLASSIERLTASSERYTLDGCDLYRDYSDTDPVVATSMLLVAFVSDIIQVMALRLLQWDLLPKGNFSGDPEQEFETLSAMLKRLHLQ